MRSARLRWRALWPGGASGHRASLIASPLAPPGWTARKASSSRALRSPPSISRSPVVIRSAPRTSTRMAGAPGVRWALPGAAGILACRRRGPARRRAGIRGWKRRIGRHGARRDVPAIVAVPRGRRTRGEACCRWLRRAGGHASALRWRGTARPGRGVILAGVPAGGLDQVEHGGAVRGGEVEHLDAVQRGISRSDDPVGGDMAGAARWPFAQHDPRDREVAARFEYAAQPLAGSWWRGDQHRGGQCRGRAVFPCAVTGLWESGVAGPAHEEGLGVVEGGVQGGRDDQAGDGPAGEAVRAGEQDGGVGGGHDDLGRAGGLAGQRLGQQAGQDRAGCRGCARAGQPQAAQGSDIDGDLLPVADPQSYHSRLYRN